MLGQNGSCMVDQQLGFWDLACKNTRNPVRHEFQMNSYNIFRLVYYEGQTNGGGGKAHTLHSQQSELPSIAMANRNVWQQRARGWLRCMMPAPGYEGAGSSQASVNLQTLFIKFPCCGAVWN